jgi:hypothetical protein
MAWSADHGIAVALKQYEAGEVICFTFEQIGGFGVERLLAVLEKAEQ